MPKKTWKNCPLKLLIIGQTFFFQYLQPTQISNSVPQKLLTAWLMYVDFDLLGKQKWQNEEASSICIIFNIEISFRHIFSEIFNFQFYNIRMYFSFRKTTLHYVSPSRDPQISMVIHVYFLVYFLIYFFVYLGWGGRFKILKFEIKIWIWNWIRV